LFAQRGSSASVAQQLNHTADAATSVRQSVSFNHLVGAGGERRWHSNAKRVGGFHIDDQLETSWLLDRQIGGPGALEDFVDAHRSLCAPSGAMPSGAPHGSR